MKLNDTLREQVVPIRVELKGVTPLMKKQNPLY